MRKYYAEAQAFGGYVEPSGIRATYFFRHQGGDGNFMAFAFIIEAEMDFDPEDRQAALAFIKKHKHLIR